jgi:hypothetical protein
MFPKASRYSKLEDVVTVDVQGRSLPSKSIRLLPVVAGRFLHTIEDVDRLDHLAFKYYRKPRKWWHICDANPEFMSPQALLGKEPVVTERFALSLEDEVGGVPPWAALRRILDETVGVIDFQVIENWELVPQIQSIGEQQVRLMIDSFERAVIVTYNTMNISLYDLGAAMAESGFVIGQPERVGRVGKSIVIPPDTIG